MNEKERKKNQPDSPRNFLQSYLHFTLVVSAHFRGRVVVPHGHVVGVDLAALGNGPHASGCHLSGPDQLTPYGTARSDHRRQHFVTSVVSLYVINATFSQNLNQHALGN